ncbi:MAG TPA: TonB-dependent receptor [Vicinamibacterales bacterium]
MKGRLRALVTLGTFLAFTSVVYAQGGTSSAISGVVVDSGGGVIPGAAVIIKHNATGVTTESVSNAEGVFSFPGLPIGTYTVTVTLEGFKTFVANDVVLTAGSPANVRARLEVGGITEQIVVSSTSEIIQTQSTTIASTINTNQITKLPLTSRSAMDFVTFVTGVSTPDSNRASTVNGLPQGAINITLDGVNIQDNTLKTSDGFFSIVSPRLDAIEEVTVTTAAQGADGAGQGAVQIKFTTRSGTNEYTGSGYHYYRNDRLNANTWFNNRSGVDKPELLQNQVGARFGGPLTIPGLYNGRGRAFFFVNYEEYRQPSDTTRTRTILNSDAQQGIFRYSAGGEVRSVNVLDLAAANGLLGSQDPVIANLLRDIRSAVQTTGSIEPRDSNLERFRYNLGVTSLRRYPTVRIDYNVTNNHRFSSAFNYNYYTDTPDTLNGRDASFPGFPVIAGQTSERLSWSNSVRSTITNSLVNEARVAISSAPVKFFEELNLGMYTGSLANQAGFHLDFPNVGSSLTNAGASPSPQSRNASTLLIEDTVTWLKGNHSITTGLSWTQNDVWLKNSRLLPELDFGLVTGDPAISLFTTANFPGASGAQLNAAEGLYSMLTGRVSQIVADARIDETTGQYVYNGVGTQRARMREAGLFVQDSWRLRPNFTVNAGLRYELQFPFTPLNSSYSTATIADLCGISGVGSDNRCNLFQPGLTPGKRPQFIQFGEGAPGYNTDYNNFAPSVGMAWTLGGGTGPLAGLLGANSGDTVLRAGYSRSFNRNGMNDFTGQYNSNPGIVISASRTNNLGNLDDGQGLPVLLRETNRLGAASFPTTPQYPITEVVTGDINLFDPDIQVPYADTWTIGIQRAISSNMAVEVRYVGTRSRDLWQTRSYNETNIFENGWIDEFRLAQANLLANLDAGRGANFRYFGPGTGTSPLPITLAHFRGAVDPNNPANYTSNSFADSDYLDYLATFNPNPFDFAQDLYGNATQRARALQAGLAENFWLANPDLLGGADLTTNNGATNYHALQIELRRRLSHGLQFNTSYVLADTKASNWQTWRRPTFMVTDGGGEGGLRHVFKANVVYDLPFGQGRRFGSGVGGVLDRIIGGWQVSLASRLHSGELVDLGNVRVVGMSMDEARDAFKLRFDHDAKEIYMWPDDIMENTIRAFNVSATSSTGYSGRGVPTGRYFAPANGPDCIEVDDGADYGDCGVRSLIVSGPMLQQHDISIAKRIPIVGRTNVEFRFEMLNAFNQHNFDPVAGISDDPSDWLVTGLSGTNSARVIQIVSRINW